MSPLLPDDKIFLYSGNELCLIGGWLAERKAFLAFSFHPYAVEVSFAHNLFIMGQFWGIINSSLKRDCLTGNSHLH
jgi:hypothetical protein